MPRVKFHVANKDKEVFKSICHYSMEDDEYDNLLESEYYEESIDWGEIRALAAKEGCPPFSFEIGGDWGEVASVGCWMPGSLMIICQGDDQGNPCVSYRDNGLDADMLVVAEAWWELKRKLNTYIEMRG